MKMYFTPPTTLLMWFSELNLSIVHSYSRSLSNGSLLFLKSVSSFVVFKSQSGFFQFHLNPFTFIVAAYHWPFPRPLLPPIQVLLQDATLLPSSR